MRAIPGVLEVVPVLPPYKLASLEAHPQPSIVSVGDPAWVDEARFGGGHVGLIAGPYGRNPSTHAR
ncbi:MAG: hypothetical protein R3B96_17765 [Pirellulaceae bacterium]